MGSLCSNSKKNRDKIESKTLSISEKKIEEMPQKSLSKSFKVSSDIIIDPGTFVSEKQIIFLLDEYDILKELGKGAYGVVKKVIHKSTSQVRAMKIIDRTAFSSKEDSREKSLLREIEVLKQLNHPHILKILEFFYDKKHFYIITEFCNGGELFDEIIKRGHFDEKLAATVMKQILMAVSFVHSQNIVHRDLKPENILLETFQNNSADQFSIKIIDFGTSMPFQNSSKLNEKIGTPYYIAPEVLRRNYDEKCDIWSCGVILYILLSGIPPFNGANNEEIMKSVKIGKYNINNIQASDEAKNLIIKLLTYNPEKRITAQQALEDIWIKTLASKSKIDNEIAKKVISSLKGFSANQKLLEATISYIVNYLASKEELEELRKTFEMLDKNNDGKLSYQEILTGYKNVFGVIDPKKETEEIFKNVDSDKNGFISYDEFIRASYSKAKFLSNNRLENAFNMFDKNKDGFIQASEIKEILGRNTDIDDEIWKKLIKEVDSNGDGGISIEEFKEMMNRFTS